MYSLHGNLLLIKIIKQILDFSNSNLIRFYFIWTDHKTKGHLRSQLTTDRLVKSAKRTCRQTDTDREMDGWTDRWTFSPGEDLTREAGPPSSPWCAWRSSTVPGRWMEINMKGWIPNKHVVNTHNNFSKKKPCRQSENDWNSQSLPSHNNNNNDDENEPCVLILYCKALKRARKYKRGKHKLAIACLLKEV